MTWLNVGHFPYKDTQTRRVGETGDGELSSVSLALKNFE
ncbi:hypothetical protein BH11PSE12_BH11PSE12_17660 [soil metagenome]